MYVPHLHAKSVLAVVFFNPRAMLYLASLSVCFLAGCHLCFGMYTNMHNIDTTIPAILSKQPSLQIKAPNVL